jgi:hypothetical protein
MASRNVMMSRFWRYRLPETSGNAARMTTARAMTARRAAVALT